MTSRKLWAALVVVFIAGCGRGTPAVEAPEPVVKGNSVKFPASSGMLSQLKSTVLAVKPTPALQLNGRMAWDEDRTVRVYSAFTGRVTRILAKPGDVVRKGQALAIVASPDFGQAQADARRAESDFALAGKTLTRMRELADHGVAPRKDLQAAEADYARAQAELARTRARLRLYGQSGDNIDQTYTLSSPIAGVVVERNINPGQELRPDQMLGGTPALFVVTNPDYLWVILDAAEKDLGALSIGKLIAIHSPAYRDIDFTATIAAISDFLDPATRTIKVRANLDNTHRKLKAEMFITAQIEGVKAVQLQLPTKAVFFQGGKHYVFIDDGDGRYTRREVTVGDEYNGSIEILDGVRDGERVVTEGTLMLQLVLQPSRVQK